MSVRRVLVKLNNINFRKNIYYLTIAIVVFLYFQKVYLVLSELDLNHFFNWNTLGILPILILGLILLIEIIWFILNKKSIKESTLIGFISFSNSKESDILVLLLQQINWVRHQLAHLTIQCTILVTVWLGQINIEPIVFIKNFHWGCVIFVFYIFDSFIQYILHSSFHRYNFLWELHKIHHEAKEMTVLNSLREHPMLDILNGIVRGVVFWFFSLESTIIILILLIKNTQSLILHSKISSNFGFLGKFFVSPQMHHLHHSIESNFYNKNFSTDLIFWDKIFKTHASSIDKINEFGVNESDSNEYWYPYALIRSFVKSIFSLFRR